MDLEEHIGHLLREEDPETTRCLAAEYKEHAAESRDIKYFAKIALNIAQDEDYGTTQERLDKIIRVLENVINTRVEH